MKKKILAISLVVSLVAVAALGVTLAYFTDTKKVDNVFTMGNISIDLKEITGYKDGEPVLGTPDANGGIDFGTMSPGSDKVKAPFIVNTGANDAYVRLKVTINNSDKFDQLFSAYNAAHTEKLLITDFIKGLDSTHWTAAGNVEDATAKTRTYTFNYNGPLAAGLKTETLFASVAIPTQLDDEFATAGISNFQIGIVAEAIQAANFANSAAAFAALDA